MNEQSHDLYIDTHLSKCSHDCCGGITTTESSANSSSNSSNSAASLSVFMNEETDKASTAVTTTDTDNDSSFSVPTPLPIIDENSFPHHYFGGNENPDSDLSNNSNNSNNNNVHSNRCLANLSYCNSGDVPGAGGSASHYSNNIIDSNAVATSSLPGAVNSEEVIMITNVLSHPDYDPSFLSGASGTAPNIELPAKAWHLRNHSGIRLNIQQEIQRLVIERTKPEVLMGQEDFTGDVLVDSGSGSGSSISPTEITSTTSTVPTPLESLYDPAYLNSIAEMSAIVENQLYYSAPTLETYCDLSTVPSRISKLLAGILKQYKEASAKAAFEATAGGATAEIKIEAGVEAGVASAASDEDADEGEDSKCAKVTASVCNSSTSNGISPALSAVTAASASTSALASGATAASSAASVALGVNATAPLVNSTVTTAATTTTTATAATEDPDLEFARVLSSLGDGGGVRDRVSDGGDAGIAATRPPVSAPAPTPAISVPVIALTSSDSLTFGRGSESTLISTAGIAGKKPRHGTVKSSTTVSSQGCSRLFIIKVLFTVR